MVKKKRSVIRLLIADNEKQIRNKLLRWLPEKNGFFVESVTNGWEVLEKIRSVKVDYYSLVILGQFPLDGPTELEVLLKIKELHSNLPVIFITDLESHIGIEALKLGAYSYLLKPISRDELMSLIRELTNEELTAKGLTSNTRNALRFLQDISNRIISAQDIDKILYNVVVGAIELTNATSGIIYLISEDRKSVVNSFQYPHGFNHPKPRLDREEGITRLVISSGRTIIFNDIKKDARVNPELYDRVKSMIAIPLKITSRVIGVLYLNYVDFREFTGTELSFLATLAYQAAIVINNARFQKILERLNWTTQSLLEIRDPEVLLEQIAIEAKSVLGADIIVVYEYNEHENDVKLPPTIAGELNHREILEKRNVASPHRNSAIFHVIKRDTPYYALDAHKDWGTLRIKSYSKGCKYNFVLREGIKSSAGFPLISTSERVGAMFVNYRNKQVFTRDMKEVMELFAASAALAIRQTRIYSQRLEDIATLQNVHEAVLKVNIQESLQLIVEKAIKISWADYASLRLKDETGKFLRLESKKGRRSRVKLLPIDDESLSGWVAKTGKAVMCPDVKKCPHYVEWYDDIKSCMAVPLNYQERVIGTLYCESTRLNAFSEQYQLDLFLTLANQAAILIENGKLIKELAEKTEHLEKLREVTNIITSGPNDLDVILKSIIDNLSKMFQGSSCAIRLYDPDKHVLGEFVATGPLKNFWVKPRFDGTTWYVINERKPLYMDDVTIPPIIGEPLIQNGLIRKGVKSIAYLPLRRSEVIIGILYLNIPRVYKFSNAERRILELFADQVAIALEKAILHTDLEKQVEVLSLEKLDAERKHMEAEKWASLGKIAGSLSHRVGNKGGMIRICISELRKYLETLGNKDDFINEELKTIELSNQYLISLSDFLFKPSKAIAEGLKRSDVLYYIEDGLKYADIPENLEIIRNYRDKLPNILGNKFLAEVFLELAANAVDAMKYVQNKKLTISIEAIDRWVEVRFIDTGLGILSEENELMFELFSRSSEESLSKGGHQGFGLWWVKTFLSDIGGDIRYESVQEVGTTFIVRLPIAEEFNDE